MILRHVRKEAEPRFTISESSPDGTHRSNHSVARCKSSLAEHTCNKQKKNVSIQDGPNGTIGCPQVEHHNRRKPYFNPVVGPPPPFERTPQQLLFPVPGSETSGSETDSDTSPNEEPALPLWTHAACNCRPHLRLFLCIAGKPPVYETVLFDFFLEMEESDTCYRCRTSADTGLCLSNRCWRSADMPWVIESLLEKRGHRPLFIEPRLEKRGHRPPFIKPLLEKRGHALGHRIAAGEARTSAPIHRTAAGEARTPASIHQTAAGEAWTQASVH